MTSDKANPAEQRSNSWAVMGQSVSVGTPVSACASSHSNLERSPVTCYLLKVLLESQRESIFLLRCQSKNGAIFKLNFFFFLIFDRQRGQ